jgi:integrase
VVSPPRPVPHHERTGERTDGLGVRLKTEGSERAVPLSPGMARALTDWKDTTDYADPEDPVFASVVGTPLGYSNIYNRVLRPALKAAGLDGQVSPSMRSARRAAQSS